MLGLSLLAMHLVSPSLAHHNKGLPHYGYFENYPQVPTEEYVRIEGRWEVGATIFNFQGIKARETSDTPNDVKFFMYIYDLEEDHGYSGPVRIDITHDGELISTMERLEPDGEGVYISRETLPSSGNYELVFTFEEGTAALPFAVDLAVDQVNWGLVGGMGLGVAVLMGLGLHGRRRRLAHRAAPVAG
jgi:hypothetical protein